MNTDLVKQTNQIVQFDFFNQTQFETMQRICKMFANSELVPDMYKVSTSNPLEKAMANCMIAIEMAQRIGASPLMIMQNMVIIYGRPSWSSKFLVATVNTCGRFSPLQYKFKSLGKIGKVQYTEYEWQKQPNGAKDKKVPVAKTFDGSNIDNMECIAFTTAKGSDSILESSPISVELAIKEGWFLKNGSKWQTMTQQMLMYRAASFWTNAYAPELSMGMRTEDEIRDIIDIDYEDVTHRVEKEIKNNANKETLTVDDKTQPESADKDGKKKEPAKEKTPENNTGEKPVQQKLTPDF